jgi:ribosome-binding factor A
MNYRPLRVGNLIREELSVLLQRDLEFPGALVTITEVDITKKMDTAHVRVSVLPSQKGAEVLKILQAARGEMQYKLVRKLNIKPMPQMIFDIDHGPENAAAVEKALMGEDNSDAGADAGHVVK